MGDDIDFSKDGITVHWKLFLKWGWKIFEILLALALGGHIIMTVHTQNKQDEQIQNIERAIKNCMEKKCTEAK